MSIDYRALCEELAREVELYALDRGDEIPDCVDRARAALAEPVAEGPTFDDLSELCSEHGLDVDDWPLEKFEALWEVARAVLARYSHQPAPPAEGEVGELVAWIRGMYWAHPDKERATRAADLLEQRHPAPVPVAERLPSASHVYFEFVISDADDCTQAGGIAPTYAQALSEGQHYLAQFHQDGPHTLELRRVEVLHSDAPLLPAGKAAKLHPAPVPVSERLPGPEDCDADGQVWVSHERLPWDEFICWTLMTMDKAKMWAPVAFWLPATALPLPAGEVQP